MNNPAQALSTILLELRAAARPGTTNTLPATEALTASCAPYAEQLTGTGTPAAGRGPARELQGQTALPEPFPATQAGLSGLAARPVKIPCCTSKTSVSSTACVELLAGVVLLCLQINKGARHCETAE